MAEAQQARRAGAANVFVPAVDPAVFEVFGAAPSDGTAFRMISPR